MTQAVRKDKWVFDGHIDMGEAKLYFGCDPLIEGNGIKDDQHEFTVNAADIHRLKRGGVKLFAASIFAFHLKEGAKDHDFKSPHRWSTELRRYKALYEEIAEESQGKVMLVRNTTELDKCFNSEAMGMFFTVEGANGVKKKTWERDLEFARDMGVVSIGGWNLRSKLWEPHSVVDGKGLTDIGKDFILKAAELGIVIDFSHWGNRAVDQALAVLPEDKIVMFSHSNCHSLKDHSRNARDEQMIEVHRRGGNNQLTFSASFHSQGALRSVRTLVDHSDHHRRLGILESTAWASDFYGLYKPSRTPKLDDASSTYIIIENEMLSRYYTPYEADGIMFNNGERLVRKVLSAREAKSTLS